MTNLPYSDALMNAKNNKKFRYYPNQIDVRYKKNYLLPNINPKFKFDFFKENAIFTIGSCFARNIEEVLEPLGTILPTKKFTVPKSEWPGRANGLLNEYNPGSIFQKIQTSLEGKESPLETIIYHNGLYYDLLLGGGVSGVEYDRVISRRKEINHVYSHLKTCETVIITLGFVEAWFDQETKFFLNRMPIIQKDSDNDRFIFKRLGIAETISMLETACQALVNLGKNILLTISPVPLQVTFTSNDCVVANEYSKSVLRVCVEHLCNNFKNIDYFPSYEIVRSAGLIGYENDNVHVLNSLVMDITQHMMNTYKQ